jgi:hypothetical protein
VPQFEFAKSTYSSGDGECVAVALNVSGVAAVRDTKCADTDGTVRVGAAAWGAFAVYLLLGSAPAGR